MDLPWRQREGLIVALTPLDEAIFNEGERLIPGVTHDEAELIRHRSSYLFLRRVIQEDHAAADSSAPVSIADLGSGTGRGCCTLAELPNSQVLGVDCSADCMEYARQYYSRPNVRYELQGLVTYIPETREFDYVVSRNALKHVPKGLQLARQAKWRKRLIFDVPYDEPSERNPHHVITAIREDAFAAFPNAELFYQDIRGEIFDDAHKPPKPNVIVCVCSRAGLPEAARGIQFPVPPCETPPRPGSGTGLRRIVRGIKRRLVHGACP